MGAGAVMGRHRVPALARRPRRRSSGCCPSPSSSQTFDGAAWLGIVPFLLSRPAAARAAAAAGRLDFPELNVRTYVTHDERTRPLVLHARRVEHARGRGGEAALSPPVPPRADALRRVDEFVHYESARAGRGVQCALPRRRPVLRRRGPGSLEAFLVERYCFYTEDGGRLYRGEIHHPPWELQRGEARVDLNTMALLPLPAEAAARALLAAAGRRHLAARRAQVVDSRCEPAAPVSARLGRRRGDARRRSSSVSASRRRASGSSPRRSHSGTDLVAALLTFFAVSRRGAAGRRDAPVRPRQGRAPLRARRRRLPRRGRALHLRCVRSSGSPARPRRRSRRPWYAFAVIGVVIAIDVEPHARLAAHGAAVSERGARVERAPLRERPRRLASPCSSACSLAQRRVSRTATRSPRSSSACSCSLAAARLIEGERRRADGPRAGSRPRLRRSRRSRSWRPAVELRRLRMRQAGGRQFADVVIGVPPGAAVGQGHAAADAVEAAVERALPNADVVVHVEPLEDAALRERAHAARVGRAAGARGAQPRAASTSTGAPSSRCT